MCRNHTFVCRNRILVCRNRTLVCRNRTFMCRNHTFVCRNHSTQWRNHNMVANNRTSVLHKTASCYTNNHSLVPTPDSGTSNPTRHSYIRHYPKTATPCASSLRFSFFFFPFYPSHRVSFNAHTEPHRQKNALSRWSSSPTTAS